MFHTWHLCISGFRQDRRSECGVERLWRELLPLSAGDTRVEILSWDEDWQDIAWWICRNSSLAPRVCIYAYSWGGDGAIALCEQLLAVRNSHAGWKQVPAVEHLVLCDAVYRSGLLPTAIPLNPWSLLPWATIRVPPIVREVTWFYQRQDRPRGHDVVAADPAATLVHPGVRLTGVGHRQIDEAQAFHHAALAAAGVPF